MFENGKGTNPQGRGRVQGMLSSRTSMGKAMMLLAIPLVMLTGCSQPAPDANGNGGNVSQQQEAANGNEDGTANDGQGEQAAWQTVTIDDYGTTIYLPGDPKVTTTTGHGKTYTVRINSKPKYMVMVDGDVTMGALENAPALQEYSDADQREVLWAFMRGSGAKGNYSSTTVAGRPVIQFEWNPDGKSWHGTAVRGQTKHGAIVLLAADGTSEEDQTKLIDSVKFAE